MKKIAVNASRHYEVLIESGIRHRAGDFVRQIGGAEDLKCAVITDSTVAGLYLEDVKKSLAQSGINTVSYIFEPGENSKTLASYCNIVEFLAENGLTRSDVIIALGGGIPGDIAGFAAATFLRGIKWIQMPTTLLAAVDSSVGGKTAVNLRAGKNLCGAFCQPNVVLCDIQTLETLPPQIFADGAAECVKYGAILDETLFSDMGKGMMTTGLAEVISRCVEIKAAVVADDEFDTGRRQLLNFGHTLGHAVEKCSDFAVSHGHAVAIGMVLVAEAAAANGICSREVPERVKTLLCALDLPVVTDIPLADLLRAAAMDKKRTGNSITLVVPEKIGKCVLKKFNISEVKEFFTAANRA